MVKMKIEIDGLLNGKPPMISQTCEIDAFDIQNADWILKSMLYGYVCQGFQIQSDVTSIFIREINKLNLERKLVSNKYMQVVNVNESKVTIRVLVKSV